MTEITDNRRTRAKARTSAKVLEAAKALFERDGYAAATIRGVATEAGMSTGAVFANYENKAALYHAVYGHAPLNPEQGREILGALRLAARWMHGGIDAAGRRDNVQAECDGQLVEAVLAKYPAPAQ